MKQREIIVVDDQAGVREMIRRLLTSMGYSVETYEDARSALERLGRAPCDLVITDMRMPEIDGIELLGRIREELILEVPVMIMTAYGSVETAVEAIKRGAFDYIEKPFTAEQLEIAIRKAIAHRDLLEERRMLKEEIAGRHQLMNIIGKSPAIQKVFRLIEQGAPTTAPIFIVGESGTGKELVAKAIHYLSPRSKQVFLSLNCAALPETLLESELFGYEKGAFTGADRAREGLVEAARGGTLFLDEVTELPQSLQVKLLRLLQEKEFLKLGGRSITVADVRILSATNQDPQELMEAGILREDLYYRLNTIVIDLPPLRERREDILLLAEHFRERSNKRHGKNVEAFSRSVLEKLADYPWPGNVRQLENAVERAVIMASSGTIRESNLPPEIVTRPSVPSGGEDFPTPYRDAKQDFERRYFVELLKRCGGNLSAAAELAGLHRVSLHKKLKDLGVSPRAYRDGPSR